MSLSYVGTVSGMGDFQLTLARDTLASTARRVCRHALDDWGLAERADDVLLVATELVCNVARHTDDGGHLRLSLHNDAILIEVTDTNPRPPRPQAVDPARLGGRGLLLVTAVAHRWGTRPATWAGRRGKTVWAELARYGST